MRLFFSKKIQISKKVCIFVPKVIHVKQMPMISQFLSELRQFLPEDRIYTDELRTLGWGTHYRIRIQAYLV